MINEYVEDIMRNSIMRFAEQHEKREDEALEAKHSKSPIFGMMKKKPQSTRRLYLESLIKKLNYTKF